MPKFLHLPSPEEVPEEDVDFTEAVAREDINPEEMKKEED